MIIQKMIIKRKLKILVLYSYNEENSHAVNLKFFIEKAVKPPNPEDKYAICLYYKWLYCVHWNLKISQCFLDLCSLKVALENISNNESVYSYCILTNSSIRDQFLPNFIKFSESSSSFLSLLSEQVSLAGTVCQCGYFHIHIPFPTMITVMDKIGFGIVRPLLTCGINNKWQVRDRKSSWRERV